MKWENLRDFKCPYCERDLQHLNGEIKCTRCLFTIEVSRFQSIAANRQKQKPTNYKKNNWQNLKEGRCPVCSEFLTPDASKEKGYNKCINYDCTFIITEQRMVEIVKDERHPSNTLYKEHHE